MPFRHTMSTLLFLSLLGNTYVQADITPTPGKQTEHEIQLQISVEEEGEKVERDVTVPFLLYVPKNYKPEGDGFPLMLFLHGAGERGEGGDQLQRVAIHGPPKQAKAGKELPFIVVSPQAPPGEGWQAILNAWQPHVLGALLDRVEQQLNVDKSRVYLTGLSMGGYGSWRLAAANPERFAAVVPICGGGEPEKWAESLAKVPIWAFHGAKDLVVPVARTQEMVDAVKKAGGNIKLTVYPEVDHDSWSQTYDNPEVYKWLLEQRRQKSQTAD